MKEEYQQGIVSKENKLKGLPSELIERFGEGNIRSVLEYIEEVGKKQINEAYKVEDPWARCSLAIVAGSIDAKYRIITGENLFNDPKDLKFLSDEEKEMFFHNMRGRENDVGVRDVAFDDCIRTGEKLGTSGQKTRIALSIRRELTSITNIKHFSELVVFYRIFTGKTIDNILEVENENKNMQNKITQEIILNNLEVRIKKGLNDKEYYYYSSVVDDIARYRILTAKEIKIIPRKGLVFTKAQGEFKPPQRL